jgi:hypothetical protein
VGILLCSQLAASNAAATLPGVQTGRPTCPPDPSDLFYIEGSLGTLLASYSFILIVIFWNMQNRHCD